MRELLIGQTVGGDPLDGLEERRVGKVGGPPPHRRKQLTHELGKTPLPGLSHRIGGIARARDGAIGIQREGKRHGVCSTGRSKPGKVTPFLDAAIIRRRR